MTLELTKFMFVWIWGIYIFTTIADLIFGEFKEFRQNGYALEKFVEFSLGAFDVSMFEGENHSGGELKDLRTLGIFFTCFFMLINTVLMLNFVIAILSDTYSKFTVYKDGLYLNELIKIFHL